MPDRNVGRLAEKLRDSVRTVRGVLPIAERRAVYDRAAARALGDARPAVSTTDSVVDCVATSPHEAPVERLLGSGRSEDEVYEIVVAAAVGAGFARVEKALALISERSR